MRLILAPQIDVGLERHRELAAADLGRCLTVDVPDESDELLRDEIASAIRSHPDTIGAEPQVDAPPYGPETWWLGVIERSGDPVGVYSFPPMHFFGINSEGRVVFPFAGELRVSDFVRAIDGGHYPTLEHTVVVTRAGEFGGNGAAVPSVVSWLLQLFPAVLLGVGADRASLRHDRKKREELEVLAADWAARRLTYPRELRRFVLSREIWFPSVLAQRLAVSENAATRLLEALGFEPAEDELMEFTGSSAGLAARGSWEQGELSEAGYVELEDLLGD